MVARTETQKEAEKMTRQEKTEKRKRDIKPKPIDFELFEREMRTQYGWLLIKDMEFEKKMRDKALRLERKRRKQIGWVI